MSRARITHRGTCHRTGRMWSPRRILLRLGYSYQGGTQCAKSRAVAPCADLLRMETKQPILAQALEVSRDAGFCVAARKARVCVTVHHGAWQVPWSFRRPVDALGILFTTLCSSAACTRSDTSQTSSQRYLQQDMKACRAIQWKFAGSV